MNSQEYELAFVETLPQRVQVVDPSTLDFSKNPAGALAFRYKHGWILINPLIPSRGLSGGGLARQHGHISGGHTTGHFVKGADGKIKFKAVNRYASKADWENEVKKGAAGVVAKQEAAKAAVQKAENATNAAEKLAASGASKAAQAAAHKVASDAHAAAVPHFQAMGKDGLKSGVLTHSAHAAIHASKADKLGQEHKAEQAAKLEAEKAAKKAHAQKLTTEANELAAKVKGGEGTPKQKAEAYKKAAEAHKAAQAANEAAGNEFTAKAHAAAAEKHEGIAGKQQQAHDALDAAATKQAATAAKASENAKGAAAKGESLHSQSIAHQGAADAHGQAANLHASIGNKDAAQAHLTQKMEHSAEAKNLQGKHEAEKAAKEAAFKKAQELSQAAWKASDATDGQTKGHDAAAAHVKAAQAHQKAKIAAQAAGDPGLAASHDEEVTAHSSLAKDIADKAVDQAKADKLAGEAKTAAAHAKTLGETPEGLAAHKDAQEKFQKAHEAAKAAGDHPSAYEHQAAAAHHELQHKNLKNNLETQAKEDAAKKLAMQEAHEKSGAAHTATGAANDSGYDGSSAQAQLDKHIAAADAHAKAAMSMNEVGWTKMAQDHKDAAKGHLEKAAKIKKILDGENGAQDLAKVKKAGDSINAGDDAMKAGDKAAAVKHYQEAAKLAEEGGSTPLHVNAMSSLAEVTGELSDHKNAMKAAAVALMKESDKDNPSAHLKKKYDNLIDHHGDAANAAVAKKAADLPTPPSKTTPAPQLSEDGKVLKPVGQLKSTGKSLGSHNNQVMVDEAGNEWLVKKDEYSRTLDPAIAKLHRQVGLATPIFVKTKDGHLQGMLPGAKDAFPNGNFDPEKLSEDEILSMLQHQVMDSATGNQDTHSGQWLKTADGKLIQVDQGQAFKYGTHSDPTKTFPPLGSDVPVYPKLWNAAKAGQVKIPDPQGDNAFGKTIKELQDMPDEQFKALFKPYAMHAQQNGQLPNGHTVDSFLDHIAEHKNKIGDEFQKLYNQLPDSAKTGGKAPGASVPTTAAPSGGKADALKAIADYIETDEHVKVTPGTYKALKQAALDSGATMDEIKDVLHNPDKYSSPKTATPAPGLSAKEKALKAIAEHEHKDADSAWTFDKANELEKAAKAAGASDNEIMKAAHKPDAVLKELKAKEAAAAPATPAASPVSKDEALKKVAEFASNPPANWTPSQFEALKKAAKDAGASPDELNSAQFTPEKHLAASAPDTPAAPSKPAVDPFKPKAKWSKVTHGAKDTNGDVHETPGLQGPKGLVVHKGLGGSGWSVTQHDGLKMGAHKFKTQKEAKLAAEWMAKNYGGKSFTSDEFAKWKADHPDEFAKFKQGVVNSHWNKEAQDELDKQNNPAGHAAKQAALQALAEHNLPDNGDDWAYDKDLDLKQAAKAAGATVDEVAAASNKPKTFLNSIGVTPAAPAPQKIKFTGLTNNKGKNALLLKQLYDQAHGPNATAEDKAEYDKAQEAWKNKHSTGAFDPTTFDETKAKAAAQPSSYSAPAPKNVGPSGVPLGDGDPEKAKKYFPDAHAAGYVLPKPDENLNHGWQGTPEQHQGMLTYTKQYPCEMINGQLRGVFGAGGKMVEPPKGPQAGTQWDKHIANIDAAFDAVEPLDKDIVVGRKMSHGGAFGPMPPGMKPGDVGHDLAYTSTSKDPTLWQSKKVHMEIRVPKGSKVLDIEPTSGTEYPGEREVLLPRGSRFKVISDSMVDGKRKIIVELLPQQ